MKLVRHDHKAVLDDFKTPLYKCSPIINEGVGQLIEHALDYQKALCSWDVTIKNLTIFSKKTSVHQCISFITCCPVAKSQICGIVICDSWERHIKF